jgi:hypothetical protein
MAKIDPAVLADHLGLSLADKDECMRRAIVMSEDIEMIGMPFFRLSSQCYPFPDLDSGRVRSLHLGEYHLGDTGFSVEKATNGRDNPATWRSGAGLSWGHLEFFSLVSLLGHHVIPDLWLSNSALRSKLRNPKQHLDTLEEVWWLGRWRQLKKRGISMDKKLRPTSKRNVDWQLQLPVSGVTVNLEVKRMKKDFDSHTFAAFCESDLLPKFAESSEGEVNVLALTLVGQMFHPFFETAEPTVNEVLEQWLASQTKIDAILVTARSQYGRNELYLHFRNKKARNLGDELLGLRDDERGMWFPIMATYELPGFPTR